VAARRTPQTRARDSDRNETCQTLDAALAEGQLSMEEHRLRVAAATKATTLGELADLVADLQPTTSAQPAPTPRGRRRLLIGATAVGVAAVAVAVGVSLFGDDAPEPAPPGHITAAPVPEKPISPKPAVDPSPDDVQPSVIAVPKQLHTLGGMNGLLDQMRQRFGDTTGIELAITPDHAMLFRPDPTDNGSKLLYRFDGGWGDPTRRPRDDKDENADLAAFDTKAVVEVLRGAPETLGIAPDDVGEVYVDIDQVDGALELLVKVEKKSGGDGYIYLDSAGNTKRVEYPS
jgi:hypothetical protein